MTRTRGSTCVVMCRSMADSAPKEELITRPSPNWRAAQSTTCAGCCFSNTALSVSRSSGWPGSGGRLFAVARAVMVSESRGDSLPAHERVPLDELVHQLPRHPPALRGAEVDVLLVAAVEVAAAGLEQAEAVGEPGVLFGQLRRVVAVNDLKAHQAHVGQVLHHALELRVVSRAELHGVGEHREPAGLVDHLHRPPGRQPLLVEIGQASGGEVLVERLL